MIPRFSIGKFTICTPLFEAEVVTISVRWLGFMFEVSVARIPRA